MLPGISYPLAANPATCQQGFGLPVSRVRTLPAVLFTLVAGVAAVFGLNPSAGCERATPMSANSR
jgi:hypothetical protein